MSVVNPADLRAAAQKVDEACTHFEAQRKSLQYVEIDRDLDGGHGKTGAYRAELLTFKNTFNDVLAQTLDDERKFVAFLEGFRDRVNQAAGLHETNELRSEAVFTRISGLLDQSGGEPR